MRSFLAVGLVALARAAATERSQGLAESIGEMPLAMLAMPDDEAPAKPRGAPPSGERAPGAKLLLLAGVGHRAWAQEPDEWCARVLDFLDAA